MQQPWGPVETGLPTYRLGDQQCTDSPNFLAVVLKKKEISQQVVTKMQDLASEFLTIFRGITAGGGDHLPHPTPLAGRGAQAPRCWDANLGPPQLFSRGCAPGLQGC